ncbi:hypothetical protein AB833_15065 [Chromatiales bacterium (ex Bugula neritina AB1)]|nr:hypothetical protein AB833_15065 [Chromatiales bacterium (ex Bugula neritina AB1)]
MKIPNRPIPGTQFNTLIQSFNIPDLAVAVTHNNNEIFSAGYGHCDAACTQKITANTLFGVASVTKLLSAISMLQLQDRGLLSLNDCVSQYFPTLRLAADHNLKLHHLLSHSSGWPGLGSRFLAANQSTPGVISGGIEGAHPNLHSNGNRGNGSKLYNTDDLVEYLNHQAISLLAKPGRLLNYGNEGFCLLGSVVEQITGSDWPDYIRQEVFKPLGMLQSTIGQPDPNQFSSIARPLITTDGHRTEVGVWDTPLFYPVGGVVASVRDLLRLTTVLAADGPLLTNNSRMQLLTPVMSVASRPGENFGYSLGLEFRQLNSGAAMHWHTGQRAGISALLAAVPAENISLALLGNSSDAPLTALAHELIANVIDGCNSRWPPASGQNSTQTIKPESCGEYGSDEGFLYRVLQCDGAFYLQRSPDSKRRLMHFQTAVSGYVGQQTFAFLTDDDVPAADTRHSAPVPWALALDLRILSKLS